MCVSCQADRAPYNVNVTTCAHESRHKSRRRPARRCSSWTWRPRAARTPCRLRSFSCSLHRRWVFSSYYFVLLGGWPRGRGGRSARGSSAVVSVSLVVVLNNKLSVRGPCARGYGKCARVCFTANGFHMQSFHFHSCRLAGQVGWSSLEVPCFRGHGALPVLLRCLSRCGARSSNARAARPTPDLEHGRESCWSNLY